MTEFERSKISNRKGPPVVAFIILLIIVPLNGALFGFYKVMRSPQFESYRTVDVVLLVGSGAFIGAAMVGSMMMLLRPRR